MDSELGNCLMGTLSSDSNLRMKAELRISELLPHPDAGAALASILASSDVNISMRQISHSIILRKYVKEHWSPFFSSFKGAAPAPEVKYTIRTAVFQALSDPSSKVRSAAANVLSLIANCDWPDSYPDLLNNLLVLLSSSSPDAVHGAMQVFTEFAKDDLTEDQILPVLRQLLPVLMNILGDSQHHTAITRARAISVFRQCLSALYMVKDAHPQAVKEALDAVLPQWVEAFKALLNQDLAAELSNENDWDPLLVRVQAFKTLDTIQTIFNRAVKNHVGDFLTLSLRHLQGLLPVFEQYCLESTAAPPTSAEDEEVSLPRLACSIVDFISNIARGSAARLWFNASHLEQLTGVIFRWIQMTSEDEESWASNANAFVAHEDDENLEYSLRVAGLDLLICLLDRYSTHATRALQNATQRLIEESNQARQQGSQDWWVWRSLEAALAALGAHASTILDTIEDEEAANRPLPFDVESLLTNVIPSLLTLSEYPFLQGRSFVFASQYAKRLSPGLSSQYLNAAIEVLEADNAGIPVKVSAVKAIRNFCTQVGDNVVISIAPRIIKDLGPFLLVTTEDTLALVLEAIRAVVQIDDGKWIDVDLALPLSQAVLEVWTKNIKDPLLLSILDELLTDLASSSTPNVYQAVVSQTLPTLCNALAQSTSNECWIASSAINLIAGLARGASRGGLGDGFFATVAPSLFGCLQATQDQETLENAVVLLTLVVRKDPHQILSWSDEQGQSGLANVFSLIGQLLTKSDAESGGLVMGDLIIHLLRNAGDAVLPILPDLMRALTNRMASAKTTSLLQSLITPFTFMIHTHRDDVLTLLESFTIDGGQPPKIKTGLQMVIETWLENAETFQGFWAQRISNLALCSLLLSGRPSLQSIMVKGDIIIKPDTSDVIVTRSRAKQTPHEFQYIPFSVKALKLLLEDLHVGGDTAALSVQRGDVASDDGNSEWADSDEDEKLVQGFKPEEFAYLSEFLGSKGMFDEDEDGIDGGLDDEDLKQDPVSTMDMKAHLIFFLKECMKDEGFHSIVDQLNAQEILVVKQAVEGH
ncbi:ARM repeat-containing protein [Hysterangium stoloniferum]|nr:ARM repeat-containing protein [Hysterangium stoloniferum]